MAKAKAKAKAKGKGGKADVVGKPKKAKGDVVGKTAGEARPRDSVANFIRAELDKGTETAKIVELAGKRYPDKKPTNGYVNWVREHAPKVSTTTVSSVV